MKLIYLCLLLVLSINHAMSRDTVVVISEIHYNPAGNTDDVEFIELQNLFSVDVDLSNWSLDGAVEFDFPTGTKILAGGRLVVARDPSALQTATGYGSALGPWTNTLSNGGEKIKLMMDAIGPRAMDEVDYSDGGQWPAAADGSGASLEKIKVNLPGNMASSWSWSQKVNGTPGGVRAGTALPAVGLNEIQSVANPAAFFVEIHNYGAVSVNLNGYVISSSDSSNADLTLGLGTLNAGGFITVNAATLGYTPADGEKLFLFTPSKALVVDSIKMGTSAKARFPDGTGRFHRPTATTPGAANTVSVSQDIVINEILYNGYPDPGTPDTPASFSPSTVINYADSWRYENTGSSLVAGWANTMHAWPSGPALLGREPSPTGNLPPQSIQTNLHTPGQITYYFEREFSFTGVTAGAKIKLAHKIDDGAVFYLNGVELGRYQMLGGSVTSTTLAISQIEAVEVVVTLDATSLVNGDNRLSVEVHQGGAGSSDMVFGLKAELLTESTPAVPGTPFAESGEEWIELHNKGGSPVSLSGWSLGDAVEFDFAANTIIPAGGYLVVAKEPMTFAAKYPGVTVVGPWDGSLSNSGERIQLEDQNGNPADEVRYYDGGRWHDFADGGGVSLELKDPRADNSLPESWAGSSTSVGWNTYTYRAVATDNGFGINNFHEFLLGTLDAGEFLLDDISVIEDPDGTPIQFIQNGNFSGDSVGSNPSGWRLAGNHGVHGKSMVVDDGGNKVFKLVSTGASREYHNHIQTTLANSQQVVEGREYLISYRAKWLQGDNQINTRLFTDWLSNTQRITVSQNWGTPGTTNSAATNNAGPTFQDLSHSPVIPNAGQSVTVSAKITDPDGLGSITLRYRRDNASSFNSVTMTHQGDGVYQGIVPAGSAGSLAQFYIQATDTHSSAVASANFPADGPDSGAFIQWQDNQANTATLHNLRFMMRPAHRQTMYSIIQRMSNYRFPGTLIVDENEIYYDVRARSKGSSSGRYHEHLIGLNIGFDPIQPFNGVHKSISIERGDQPNQIMAKHLMSNAGKGIASFFDDPIRLVFPSDSLGNLSRTSSALLSASRYSSAWRKSQFDNGNDGTLYNFELLYNPLQTTGEWKNSFPWNHVRGAYEFADLPLGKETYRWGFQIRSNLKRDNYEPLINTAKSMGLSGMTAVTELEKYIDVNQWARTWAWLGLTGNDDIYTRIFDHNFRMFSRPSDGRLVALPWDLDRTFRLSSNTNLIGNDNLGSYLNQPTVKRLFMQHVQHLCQTTLNATYASPWASHFASKTGHSFSSYASYITNRRNYALSQLPSNVNFAITSNSGNNFSVNASSTVLQGNGWINVAAIQVNGVNTPVTWVDDNSWQIDVPLDVGANPLTLTAHDLEGAQVGTDSITVINTSTTDLASPTNLVLTELMYHPVDPSVDEQAAGFISDDDFEFIELLNTGPNEIDLSACNFTSGITYTVPNGTLMASGARLIIANNPTAFTLRYGSSGKQVIGGYTGKLSNSGETITMAAANTVVIFSLTYDDGGTWPDEADGAGYTLVNLAPITGTNLDLPVNWSPSRELGGASGAEDLYTYTSWLAAHPELAAAGMAGENDDFDQDGAVNFLEYGLNSDPNDPASTPDQFPMVAEINPGTGTADFFTYSLTRPIAIPGVSYTPESSITLDSDWDNDPATVGGILYSRIRNGTTETLTYRSRQPLSARGRLFLRIKLEKN